MQTFRSHGRVDEPAAPRERVFGAPPRGCTGRHGRHGPARPAAQHGAVGVAPVQSAEERHWVDQDFEEPFLE